MGLNSGVASVSHTDALKVVSCTVLVNLYAELMENCPVTVALKINLRGVLKI